MGQGMAGTAGGFPVVHETISLARLGTLTSGHLKDKNPASHRFARSGVPKGSTLSKERATEVQLLYRASSASVIVAATVAITLLVVIGAAFVVALLIAFGTCDLDGATAQRSHLTRKAVLFGVRDLVLNSALILVERCGIFNVELTQQLASSTWE